MTWQTNLAIFDDTVRKTPNFKVVRGLYMLALYENGRYDEALEQYRIAGTMPSLKYDEKFDSAVCAYPDEEGPHGRGQDYLRKGLAQKGNSQCPRKFDQITESNEVSICPQMTRYDRRQTR